MLDILKSIRNQSEVSRLRKRGRVDETPGSYVELGRKLLRQGAFAKANEAAREGLAKFPHSDELKRVLHHTFRHLKAEECEELRRRCRYKGHRNDFLALANLHLECDSPEEALQVLEELHQREGEAADAALLRASILFGRFRRDLVAQDAQRGEALANRAIELGEDTFEAHDQLARFYDFVGLTSKALFHAFRLVDLKPGDENVEAFHARLLEEPLEEKSLDALIRELEEVGDHKSPPLTPEKRLELSKGLQRLSEMHGVTRAAFVDSGLTIVAKDGESHELGDKEVDPLCELARGFHRAASISSKRMGIGAFQSSVLTAGDCMLQFYAAGSLVVLIESNEPNRAKLIHGECELLVASFLRLDEEPVDA